MNTSRTAAQWLGLMLLMVGNACGSSSSQGPDESAGGSGGSSAGAAGGAGAPMAGAGASAAGASGAGASGAGAGAGAGGDGMAGSFAGGGASSGQAGSAGENAGTGGASAELCPKAPAPRVATGTVIEMPIELTFDGAPFLFAEENPVPGGGTVTPLGVRFYVSDVALLRDGADPLPVDIVTSAATVAPYGVHLFNADDDTSTTLRLLAPAGDYRGITFLWGLAQPCNTRSPESSEAPLSPTSEMTWPHTGFLFFRYEARTTFPDDGTAGASGAGAGGAGAGGMSAGGAGAGGVGGAGAGGAAAGSAGANGGGAGDPAAMYPSVIHMGGSLFQALAPEIQVEGALTVPPTGPMRKGLRIAVDEIFKGALADIDLTGFAGPPGEEVLLGERLRQSLPELDVFSFSP